GDLFINGSYDDVTMTQSAEEAGMTKGALYHHFKTKDELYLTMMHRYLERVRDLLQDTVTASGTARQRLQCLTTTFLNMPFQEQRMMQLVRRDTNRFQGEARQHLVRAYQEALPNQIEQIVRDGITAGEIVDHNARLLAWQFVAVVEVALSAYARQFFGDPEQMAAYLTNIFFDGAGLSSVAGE
ncbi:MAG: TetR/AcrR family transcriptional regulator, partial [Anaerolineae bacterium]|nr:TetR/AcrR family transcriptional regulator [Anaerolineae bacterium]